MNKFFLYKNNKNDYSFSLKQCFPGKNALTDKNVSADLTENKKYICQTFNIPKNGDIVLREFSVKKGGREYAAILVSVDGLSDGDSINDFILKPLMLTSGEPNVVTDKLADYIENRILTQGQITRTDNLREMAEKVNIGNAALLIDTMECGFIVDVKSWEHRGIGSPENEAVIQGPHEGFNEVLRSNTALIRKTLNNPNLIMENVFLGKTSKTPGALVYLGNVTNTGLVDEIRRRINEIDAEYILSSLDVEQYIEEESYTTLPQIMTTERPDRVCKAVSEGRAALVMNGSPHVLVMPVTFFDLITSAEDEYLRYPYSVFVRILRYAAAIIASLFPAVFVSLMNYHPELLMTNLTYAIASSRSAVPLGAVAELLLMELAFELIKEAGIRVPGPIGSTLGIVGGLIVGQAAVDANIVSPIMIIIVAVTGISAFTIPSYSLSFSFRFSRFLYIFGAAVAGLAGVTAVFFVNTLAAAGTKSFGVPFLSPMCPRESKSAAELIFGRPIWKRGEVREEYLKPRDIQKKGKISRKWLYRR